MPERWLYFDCFAGLSGDMTLGALLDLGLSRASMEEVFNTLGLGRVEVTAQRVNRAGLTGIKVDFLVSENSKTRHYQEICNLIFRANLSPAVRELSLSMFRLLGEAEAQIHGLPLEEVHFHELGAVDTILDVVGVAFGVTTLGIARTFTSPIPQGQGLITGCHGVLPNPAPATLALLTGLPLYSASLPGELVTPTGAVILKALSAAAEPLPALNLLGVGYGAGSRDLPGHPNLLRLYLGEPLASAAGITDRVLVLETNIDDMNPELYEPLMAGLFRVGALDVSLTPAQMKKNRPGVRLTVIAPPGAKEGILEKIFTESTTIGVRLMEMERVTARRWADTIETPYGPLTVKVIEYGGRRRLLPEYEACRRLAEEKGLPLIEVYRLIPAVVGE